MEVGPLARMLVGYASGREDFKEVVDSALTKLDVPAEALFSTLGRTAARGLETQLVAQWNLEFYDKLIENQQPLVVKYYNNRFHVQKM